MTRSDHIGKKVEISCRHNAGLGNENGKTGDSAKCKLIGKFEKIRAGCHDQRTERQQEKTS